MPEMRNFMTSQDWGPHHDVKLLDMMEMESLKMEIGNFKLIKIAFKCWEAAQNKTGPYFGGQSYLEDNKVAMKMGGPKVAIKRGAYVRGYDGRPSAPGGGRGWGWRRDYFLELRCNCY